MDVILSKSVLSQRSSSILKIINCKILENEKHSDLYIIQSVSGEPSESDLIVFLNTILYDENNISNCYLLLVDLVKKKFIITWVDHETSKKSSTLYIIKKYNKPNFLSVGTKTLAFTKLNYFENSLY